MRLGILGPAQGDLPALARGAQYLLDEARVERVVYLAADDALDRVVASWAGEIVGDANTDGLLARAAARCAGAEPGAIDAFVEGERARLRLQVLTSLPSNRRSIEILDGRVVLFVWDKSTLDEDDIAAASILCFGKSNEALIKKVGTRTFVAPGPVGGKDGGCAVLDDGDGGVRISIVTSGGQVTAKGSVGAPITGAKMRVQGGG